MKFTDFKQSDLIGKLVVWITSDTVSNENTKKITTISQATRREFQVTGYSGWFTYRSGQERNVSKIGYISYCQLITEQEAEDMKAKWLVTKSKLELIDQIVDDKRKLLRLDISLLQRIVTAME